MFATALPGCAEILGIEDLPDQAGVPDADADGVDGSAPPSCATPPDGIIAWWDGDTMGGDLVGGFSNPTVRGEPTLVSGIVGQAMHFGEQDLLDYDLAPVTTAGDDFTLEAWVYLDRIHDDYFGIYGRYFQTAVCTYFSTLVLWDSSLGGPEVGNVVTSQSELNQRWSHIAVTWDESTAYLYIDGVQEDSGMTGVRIKLPADAQIGGLIDPRDDSLVDRFEGVIDELTLYDRALGAEEILAIYEAGADGKCKP